MIQAIIVIGIAIVIIAIIVFSKTRNTKNDQDRNEWDLLNFIEQNPHRASFYVTKNNEVLAASAPKQMMPLAHIVNIVITIEYTRQVSKGFIDQHQIISLSDLELYDIPAADGGAHAAWAESFKRQHINTIHQDKVRLHDVVRGMLHYNSHANTAFLLDMLDLNQINRTLHWLNIDTHEDIYYFTASFLLPAYLHTEESLSKRKVKQKLKDMSIEDFRAYSGIIHSLLKHRQAHDLIHQSAQTNMMDSDIQKIIFARFPQGTVEEYGQIMNKIFHTEDFEEHQFILVKDLLKRQPLEQESTWDYFGGIGGGTPFTNNYIVYGITEPKQHSFIFGVCTKDLNRTETTWIREEMGMFISRCLTDQEFQDALIKRFTEDKVFT